MPWLMSQTAITQPCYGAIHEVICHLNFYTDTGATRKIEMKNLNLQVTLPVQKGVPFPPHHTPRNSTPQGIPPQGIPFPPHHTPAYEAILAITRRTIAQESH